MKYLKLESEYTILQQQCNFYANKECESVALKIKLEEAEEYIAELKNKCSKLEEELILKTDQNLIQDSEEEIKKRRTWPKNLYVNTDKNSISGMQEKNIRRVNSLKESPQIDYSQDSRKELEELKIKIANLETEILAKQKIINEQSSLVETLNKTEAALRLRINECENIISIKGEKLKKELEKNIHRSNHYQSSNEILQGKIAKLEDELKH